MTMGIGTTFPGSKWLTNPLASFLMQRMMMFMTEGKSSASEAVVSGLREMVDELIQHLAAIT